MLAVSVVLSTLEQTNSDSFLRGEGPKRRKGLVESGKKQGRKKLDL